MIPLLILLLMTYTAAVAETALAPLVEIYGAVPQLLALAAIVWIMATPPNAARIVEVACVGLVSDFNSGGHAGVGWLAFALLAGALIPLRTSFRRLGALEQGLACVPALLAVLLAIGVGNQLLGHHPGSYRLMVVRGICAAIYTALLSLPIWLVLDWRADARRAAPRLRQG